MTTSSTPTAHAVSPDSGEHWSAEGAWQVAEGIHRIPLPLPMDGLRAVNVYAIETDDGLTLIDGGWSIQVARDLLERCLRDIGYGFGDIRRFLVTHIHRDHYTLATVLGHEYDAEVALGLGEKPGLDLLNVMRLHSPQSAILSAVIFNAIIIVGLIPLALRGVRYTPGSASKLLSRNLYIYGLGGILAPFIGITLIDLVIRFLPGM